jgi:hypothetical protein
LEGGQGIGSLSLGLGFELSLLGREGNSIIEARGVHFGLGGLVESGVVSLGVVLLGIEQRVILTLHALSLHIQSLVARSVLNLLGLRLRGLGGLSLFVGRYFLRSHGVPGVREEGCEFGIGVVEERDVLVVLDKLLDREHSVWVVTLDGVGCLESLVELTEHRLG